MRELYKFYLKAHRMNVYRDIQHKYYNNNPSFFLFIKFVFQEKISHFEQCKKVKRMNYNIKWKIFFGTI